MNNKPHLAESTVLYYLDERFQGDIRLSMQDGPEFSVFLGEAASVLRPQKGPHRPRATKAHRRMQRPDQGRVQATRGPSFPRQHAVSEVLGVIMLLAMVMTITAGVIAFLQLYLTDFEDNVNRKSANGIADRLDDRLAVAARPGRRRSYHLRHPNDGDPPLDFVET